MRQVVESLRMRFQECRRADSSLEAWRALQLEILDVAKKAQRLTAEQEDAAAARSTAESRAALWAMLGDAFWLEHDPTRLTCMIEGVIVELERHGGTTESADS